MRIALLCSGLGHIKRGHEVFARDLFSLLKERLDITLFKGGGEPAPSEIVIDNVSRLSPLVGDVHVAVSPKWAEAKREQERIRIEGETFAYASLKPLLEGEYEVVHCLEQEVCNVIFDNRHLFRRPPKVVFSNGGAIPADDLPRCDFVQEHTAYNLRRSDRRRAFMIPHGVDLKRFRADVASDFRARHGIPQDAFLAISVGTICYWHKRMDYVIRELAPLPDVYLAIVGQDGPDSSAIRAMGRELMGERIIFTSMAHDALPQAYVAANVFVLGSLFETFGIVYIEAMAMGLPVVCTNHENQRSIVQEGIFIDMARPGALTETLRRRDAGAYARIGKRGREIVQREYDLEKLAASYVERYRAIAAAPSSLPCYSWKVQLRANAQNAWRQTARLWHQVIN